MTRNETPSWSCFGITTTLNPRRHMTPRTNSGERQPKAWEMPKTLGHSWWMMPTPKHLDGARVSSSVRRVAARVWRRELAHLKKR